MSLGLVIYVPKHCVSVQRAWGLYSRFEYSTIVCEGGEKYLVPSVNH